MKEHWYAWKYKISYLRWMGFCRIHRVNAIYFASRSWHVCVCVVQWKAPLKTIMGLFLETPFALGRSFTQLYSIFGMNLLISLRIARYVKAVHMHSFSCKCFNLWNYYWEPPPVRWYSLIFLSSVWRAGKLRHQARNSRSRAPREPITGSARFPICAMTTSIADVNFTVWLFARDFCATNVCRVNIRLVY